MIVETHIEDGENWTHITSPDVPWLDTWSRGGFEKAKRMSMVEVLEGDINWIKSKGSPLKAVQSIFDFQQKI